MRTEPAPLQPDALTFEFVLALHDRAIRDGAALFLAEGLRFFHASRDAGLLPAAVVVCRSLLGPKTRAEMASFATSAGTHCLEVSEPEFARLSKATEPSGLLLVLKQPWRTLPDRIKKTDLWLGVEHVRSPGNLGTLMRAAAAFGATGIMVFGPPKDRCDPFDPGAVRASMGALFALRVVGTSHQAFRRWNRNQGMVVLGASCDAPTDVRKVSLRRPVVLMLGNERKGLSEGQRATCDGFVRIPMAGGVDSLNLAMAGSVLLYEAMSQRRR